ncbi:MAG: hypothetical protein M1814_004498 [Vezdaea aestivalis]|nr:MAG: hypothetical protein M1814_004498 [Vezdaea aestivalis]
MPSPPSSSLLDPTNPGCEVEVLAPMADETQVNRGTSPNHIALTIMLMALPEKILRMVIALILPSNMVIEYTFFNRINANRKAFKLEAPKTGIYSTGLKEWTSFAVTNRQIYQLCATIMMQNNNLHMLDGYRAVIPSTEWIFSAGIKSLRAITIHWHPWESDKKYTMVYNGTVQKAWGPAVDDFNKWWRRLATHTSVEKVHFIMKHSRAFHITSPDAIDWLAEAELVKTLKSVRFDFLHDEPKPAACQGKWELGNCAVWDRAIMSQMNRRRDNFVMGPALVKGQFSVLNEGVCEDPANHLIHLVEASGHIL